MIIFSSVKDARPEEEYVVSHMKHSIRIDYETDDILSLVEMCDEKLKGMPMYGSTFGLQ